MASKSVAAEEIKARCAKDGSEVLRKELVRKGGKTVEEVEAMNRATLVQAAYDLRVAGVIGGAPHSPSKNAPAPSPQPQISEMLQFMQFRMEQNKKDKLEREGKEG